MENVLEQLFSLSTLVFCLVIWVIVMLQRRLVDVLWKKAEKTPFYREIVVPMAPLFFGGLLAGLISEYPYPEHFASLWPRIFFGIVCGLASAHVYRMVRQYFRQKTGKDIEEAIPFLKKK